MGASVSSTEKMIKKLENEVIDKRKAEQFHASLSSSFLSWEEKQICKKRTGVPKDQLDDFLEAFKNNNDLTEEKIKCLRDMKYCDTIEDKVRKLNN